MGDHREVVDVTEVYMLDQGADVAIIEAVAERCHCEEGLEAEWAVSQAVFDFVEVIELCWVSSGD